MGLDVDEPLEEEPTGLSVPALEQAIRDKREQAMQEAGILPEVEEEERTPPPPVVPPPLPPEVEEPGEEVEEPREPVEPPEPSEEVEEQDFYVRRYKTREAAEEAYAEKDATIDRLFQENAELRQRQQQPQEQEQPQFDPQLWSDWAAEQVANGAGPEAANVALQHGGTDAYDIYLAHWLNDPDQAVQALAFNNRVQRIVQEQQAFNFIAPLLQEREIQQNQEDAVRARSHVASQHPDYDDFEEEMDKLVLSESGPLDKETKDWLEQTARQGLKGKIRALEYLYGMAVQQNPGRRTQREVATQARKSAAEAAKLRATVSSSEATGSRTPLSEAESAVIEKKNAIRAKLGQPLIPTE